MFLNNALEDFRGATVIPNTFRVNDRYRASHTNAQAVGFASEYERLRFDEFKFFESRLEILPRPQCGLSRGTFGFGRVCAEEDMAAESFQAQLLNGGF
jgi:hypothetical protein